MSIYNSWSHKCICPTWSIYNQRRLQLSDFPFGSVTWYTPLLDRSFQLSEHPYKDYLIQDLGVISPHNDLDDSHVSNNWWTTEVDGWIGGLSGSAKLVDPGIRKSYMTGFGIDPRNPHCRLELVWIPPERRVMESDIQQWINSDPDRTRVISGNWIHLMDWKDYYDLRGIPSSSPVALLCTFPLSIYYAIQQYGLVHVAVAAMMKRPLRIHVVGAEKEINFLDLFKEIAFILSVDTKVS